MRLSETGEFGLIRHLGKRIKLTHPRLITGIGDDAAVVSVANDTNVVATTDMLVEGVHFNLRTATMRQIGIKSMAVNISDIAAMGADPICALVSLGAPGDMKLEAIDEFYEGLIQEASHFDTDIAGGDTIRSSSGVIINVTLIGEVASGSAILRSGAKPGDIILVTGDLGASAAGFHVLSHQSGRTPQFTDYVLARHLEPHARLRQSQLIRQHGPTSLIDISDGLANEINHICASSNVGAVIIAEKIPIHDATKKTAAYCGLDPLQWALYGGEDYELLFTVKPDVVGAICSKVFKDTGVGVSVIGRVLPPTEGCKLLFREVESVLPYRAFDHFSVFTKG